MIDGKLRQASPTGSGLELADQINFFNFNRFQCLWQAYDRYRRNRGQVRGSMAPGCMEKFDLEFLLWILWNGRRKRLRNRYRQVAQAYPHKFTVCRSRRDVRQLMEGRL